MVKVGLYLPVYGGWLPRKDSAKAKASGVSFEEEGEHPPTYAYVREVALKAEEIGVDSLWIPDHLLNPIKGERAPCLEAWTLAVALAEATSRITIAHTTLCEAFRYPGVLAKQGALLAEISRGRFILSLGAGWFRREYQAYGLPFLSHDERIERAREAMTLVRRLWEEEEVAFHGRFYSVDRGILEPKPLPRPPLWYAGMSHPSRELVADMAEGWLMAGGTLEDVERNILDMEGRLEKRGRDRIDMAVPGLAFIRATDREAEGLVERVTGGNRKVLDRTLDTGLVGSPRTVAQKVLALADKGAHHVLFQLTPTLEEMDYLKEVVDLVKGEN